MNLTSTSEVGESPFRLNCKLLESKAKLGINAVAKDLDNLATEGHLDEEGARQVLQGLFKKASPGELQTMHRIFSGEAQSAEWKDAFATLKEEINKTSI